MSACAMLVAASTVKKRLGRRLRWVAGVFVVASWFSSMAPSRVTRTTSIRPGSWTGRCGDVHFWMRRGSRSRTLTVMDGLFRARTDAVGPPVIINHRILHSPLLSCHPNMPRTSLPTYPAPTTQIFLTGLHGGKLCSEQGVSQSAGSENPGEFNECDSVRSSPFDGPKKGLDAGVVGLVEPLQQLSSEVPRGEAIRSIVTSWSTAILSFCSCFCFMGFVLEGSAGLYTPPSYLNPSVEGHL